MGNGIGAGFVGDLNEALGDQRARDGGAQQILALVDGIGAEHGEYEVAHELLAQVVNIDFLDAHGLGLGAGGFEFLTLADIGGERHHLTAVVILQPAHDDRGVQTTGIGQYNFVYIRHFMFPGTVIKKGRTFYRRVRAIPSPYSRVRIPASGALL